MAIKVYTQIEGNTEGLGTLMKFQAPFVLPTSGEQRQDSAWEDIWGRPAAEQLGKRDLT